jgi:hypothetical protein
MYGEVKPRILIEGADGVAIDLPIAFKRHRVITVLNAESIKDIDHYHCVVDEGSIPIPEDELHTFVVPQQGLDCTESCSLRSVLVEAAQYSHTVTLPLHNQSPPYFLSWTKPSLVLKSPMMMSMFPSPEPFDPNIEKQQLHSRVDDWLTRQHGGYESLHSKQLARAFENRLRGIYGLDNWEFGDVEVHTDEMHRCGEHSVIALMTVKDEEGLDLIPDRRLDVLADFKLNPARCGVILELISHPIQVTLVAADGNPNHASLVPILSDGAFSELDEHKSAAVTRLKAIRSHDELSGYPVNQPSLLVNLVLRTVASAVRARTIEAGIDPACLAWVPVRLDDLESDGSGLYNVKVSLPNVGSSSPIIAGFNQENHRVKVQFNRFFGTIERQWLSSEACSAS